MKKSYLIALILLCCSRLHAQQAGRMDNTVFGQKVLNQTWMAVSDNQKEDHEDLFFLVFPEIKRKTKQT